MEQRITLLVDPKGKKGVVPVRITDILYLSFVRTYRKVAFYTADATYYFTGSKEHWTDVLNNSGGNFLDIDRLSSVNVEKVMRTSVDPYYAYFEKFRRIGEMRCWMSKRGYLDLQEELSLTVQKQHKLVPIYQ